MERSFSIKRLQVWVWVLGGLFGTARASFILYSRWVNSVFFARLVALPRPLRAPLLWHHTDGQCCKARGADLASEASRKLGEKPGETGPPRNMWGLVRLRARRNCLHYYWGARCKREVGDVNVSFFCLCVRFFSHPCSS